MNLLKTVAQKPWTISSSLVTIILAVIAAMNIETRIYLGYMQLALGFNQILLFIETKRERTLGSTKIALVVSGMLCLIVGAIIVINSVTMN